MCGTIAKVASQNVLFYVQRVMGLCSSNRENDFVKGLYDWVSDYFCSIDMLENFKPHYVFGYF